MSHIDVRKKILQSLYDAFKEHGFVSRLPMFSIFGEMPIGKRMVENQVQYLQAKGFLKIIGFGSPETGALISITEKGIDFVEGPSEFNLPRDYGNQAIEITGSTVGPIIQGTHINFSPSVFADQLSCLVENHPDISHEQKRRWRDLLLEIPKKILDELIQAAFRHMGS